MIIIKPIEVKGHQVIGIEVTLPKTTLLAITTEHGYIMCGALDIRLLNEKLKERRIVAGRAVGVRTIEQLLDAPLDMITLEAELHGIHPGMKGSDALVKMTDAVNYR
ncbi:YunC family protein [Cohnella sp.]|uniref:YunC family protein n=1 Tax=Cohnella sp. TaxID=1883426 RepID=UPI0035619F50